VETNRHARRPGEIVACANQKGGVGKTTTVVNLGSYLALEGRRILIVDLDPQGNASSGLGVERDGPHGISMYDALVGDEPVAALVRPTAVSGLMVIPSTRDLAGIEVSLVPLEGRERRLARALAPLLGDFDYVLLDCPPSVGLLTVNALAAADSVLIPIQCEYYALEGLTQLMSTIALVRENLNPDLTVKGVVMTMYDARTTLSGDVTAEVRRHLGDRVFSTMVPRSIRLAEAPSYGRPIVQYSPESRGAHAYRDLAGELLRRDGLGAAPGALPVWATTP
jgi:chromosome partitioning protein